MINHNKGEIKDIPQEHIDAGMKGAAGGLGMIGGAAKGLVKMAGAFANTAKQYLGRGAFSNAAKQYLRGGKVAKKTSNFRPLITGNKVYNKKMIDDAFKSRFGSSK